MDSVRLAGALAASGLLCAPVGASVPAASAAPAPAASALPDSAPAARAAPGPGAVPVAAVGRPGAVESEGSPNTRQIVVGVCLAGGALLGMAGLALHRRRTTRPPAPREREDALRPREPSRSRAGPPGADRTDGADG
ncbi:hypothetical protein [Streptomyces albus]|uniref:hypothetical protein n=1 Tax=Streptomyces albus TaxID=1888 RepID=UPI0004C62FAB|nr:hypothetical protein [Streptomyces albus]